MRYELNTIREQQGWSDWSVMELLTQFIVDKGLQTECLQFLDKRAAEENAGAIDLSPPNWEEDFELEDRRHSANMESGEAWSEHYGRHDEDFIDHDHSMDF
jgi:hypothetical protein